MIARPSLIIILCSALGLFPAFSYGKVGRLQKGESLKSQPKGPLNPHQAPPLKSTKQSSLTRWTTKNKKSSPSSPPLSKRSMRLGKMSPKKAPKKEVKLMVNDPLIHKKWSLQQVQAQSAWLKYSKGSRKIVVAVIDTGIDIRHPDLVRNIWTNPKEIPNNNKDDDNNGYIDDIHGWNFVHNNNKVRDTHGHGTHVAGIIGAEGGNKIGISGVAPRVSLMALKYYDPKDDGQNNLSNTVKAINYAVENGAHIINYSGGGLEGNPSERKAIQRAEEKGVLFVAAAGNERSNMDKKKYYPASYPFSNILPVTATDTKDQVLVSSNWGKSSVQGAAPGRNIFSTLPGGRYGFMTGTSQATPLAAGTAVLIMDYYKIFSPKFVIQQLAMTGDIKQSLEKKTRQRRRLNIFRALAMRNKLVNFMDEVIDSTGKTFLSGRKKGYRDTSSVDQNLKEIQMIHQFLEPNLKAKSKKAKPHQVSKKVTNNKKRGPASISNKVVPKNNSLRRWSWSRRPAHR